jgi:hypothetical protein
MLSKPGALADLTRKFQSAGLGNILQSWIGTGQNLPISADQVRKVLGAGAVTDLAKKAGIGEPETSSALGLAAAGHRQDLAGWQRAGGEHRLLHALSSSSLHARRSDERRRQLPAPPVQNCMAAH